MSSLFEENREDLESLEKKLFYFDSFFLKIQFKIKPPKYKMCYFYLA